MGEEMFILWRIRKQNITLNANMDVVHACIQQNARWLQGVGGMGYWRAKKKMDTVHEEV